MPSIEQRDAALAKGNATRKWRAEIKRDLKQRSTVSGKKVVAEIIQSPHEYALTWRCADLVAAVRLIGSKKQGAVLRVAGIGPDRTIGGLSDRQRKAIAHTLTGGRA